MKPNIDFELWLKTGACAEVSAQIQENLSLQGDVLAWAEAAPRLTAVQELQDPRSIHVRSDSGVPRRANSPELFSAWLCFQLGYGLARGKGKLS